MNTIHLNGSDPYKVAKLIGGTVILVNLTDDTVMISGGDISKLSLETTGKLK